MPSGVRFRAYPSAAQAAALRVWIGHQRFIYNAKVGEAEYWRAFARGSLSLTGRAPLPDQAYSHFITEDSAFLRQVPSQVLRNGAYRFSTGCARMFKGLGSAPTVRKKHGRQSVLLTSELFRFVEAVEPGSGEVRHELHLGTPTRPLGRLRFKAHRSFELPKMLSVSVEPDGRWFVSFSYEAKSVESAAPQLLRTPQELAYEFNLLSDEALQEVVVGLDRGVVLPVASSEEQQFTLGTECRARLLKKERSARRHQRRLARQTKGGRNRAKARARLARVRGYGANVRQDFAHKVSHALVTSSKQVFVFEDLKLQNMTARPAPRQDDRGRYTANGAAAKAGLNKALLGSALGLVKQFTAYKAAQRNKLVLSVSPYRSSQTCARCAHAAAENRATQALFACVACGHTDNADHNAAVVLQQRGITLLRSGASVSKPKKTARVRGAGGKKKVGPVRPEPDTLTKGPTPVENTSDSVGGQAANDATFAEAGNRHLNATR